MRAWRFRLVIPLLLVLVAGLLSTSFLVSTSQAGAQGEDPFIGAWKSVDLFDGSNQRLSIEASDSTYSLVYFDRGGSMCGCDDEGNPLYSFIGIGEGTIIADNTIEVEMLFRCLSRPPVIKGPFSFNLKYCPSSDTLEQLEWWGEEWVLTAVWYRMGVR